MIMPIQKGNLSEASFLLVIIPVAINLFLLDFAVAQNVIANRGQNKTKVVGMLQTPDTVVSPSATSSSSKVALPTATPTVTPVSTFVPIPDSPTPAVREYYIPFGQGTSTATDWTDVEELQVTIDSKLYGMRRDVLFEASMHIPTGNETAYVRLYNVTDKHPVWFSDVSMDGGAGRLLVSKPVHLDEGKKLYQVQMKTSLGSQAVLDQARLHVVVY